MSSECSNSPLAVWEFRYSLKGKSPDDIRNLLEGIAKHYVFQAEKGDGGYLHYQGRLSLIKKRRAKERHLLLNVFKEPPLYLQPTTKEEYRTKSFCYVMKEDTRIDGPWTDKDEVKILTKQLKIFMEYQKRPYQDSLKKMATRFDMRAIDLIYDPRGHTGKSLFSEYLEYCGIAEEIPPHRLMDDIFQWVCTRPIKECYVVDMPRGMKKDKLGDFYSGIEVIKNGVAYDKRYSARKIRFDRPRIFVFTNMLPEFKLMSRDRWNVWEIDYNSYELKCYKQFNKKVFKDKTDYSIKDPIEQKEKALKEIIEYNEEDETWSVLVNTNINPN